MTESTTAIAHVQHQELDVMKLGEVLARSGYFQDAKEMAQAVVKVLAGRELGFGPIASMTGFHIVKGKVSMSANLMAAAIKRSGKYNYRITEHSERACKITFFEGGQQVGEVGFTIDDATRIGLMGNPTWKQFPRNMLFARALSNGAKWYCPDIFGGPVYTPEELGAEVDGEGEMVQPREPNKSPRRATADAPTIIETTATPPAVGDPPRQPQTATTSSGKTVDRDTGEVLLDAPAPQDDPRPAAGGTTPADPRVALLAEITATLGTFPRPPKPENLEAITKEFAGKSFAWATLATAKPDDVAKLRDFFRALAARDADAVERLKGILGAANGGAK